MNSISSDTSSIYDDNVMMMNNDAILAAKLYKEEVEALLQTIAQAEESKMNIGIVDEDYSYAAALQQEELRNEMEKVNTLNIQAAASVAKRNPPRDQFDNNNVVTSPPKINSNCAASNNGFPYCNTDNCDDENDTKMPAVPRKNDLMEDTKMPAVLRNKTLMNDTKMPAVPRKNYLTKNTTMPSCGRNELTPNIKTVNPSDFYDSDAAYAASLEEMFPTEDSPTKDDNDNDNGVLRLEQQDLDAAYAATLEEKFNVEAEIEQNHRNSLNKVIDCSMDETYSGIAWKFVAHIQEIYTRELYDICSTYHIHPIAVDDMFPLAENMFIQQADFIRRHQQNTPCNDNNSSIIVHDNIVDIGYHYSSNENLSNIGQNGLLTHAERLTRNIRSKYYHGSVYGDGIYTVSKPKSSWTRYGDAVILLARIKGTTKSIHKLRPPPNDNTNPLFSVEDLKEQQQKENETWNINIDSKHVRKVNPEDDIIVLRSSTQCVPLLKFPSSIVEENNEIIALVHCIMQEAIDEFFNTQK